MTVSADNEIRLSYTGSGTTGPFTTPYFLADADIKAVKVLISDGTETLLVLTTDYTLTGAGDEDGGALTLVATLSASYRLVIINNAVNSQEAEYPANDPFPSATHQAVVDRRTMVSQRHDDQIGRTLRQPDGDTADIAALPAKVARASQFLAFDSDGDPIAADGTAGESVVSAFMATVLDDATKEDAAVTLGVVSLTGGGTMTVPFIAADGTLAAPGIRFAAGGGTGFRSTGANTMEAVAAGTTTVVQFGTSGLAAIPNGAAATPSLTWAANAATGLYSTGANSMGVSSNGTKVADFVSSGFQVAGIATANQHYSLQTTDTAISGKMENSNAAFAGIIHTIQATATAAGTGWQLIGGYDSTVQVFKVFGNGNVQNTNNSYAGISDLKYKRDIEPAKSQWSDIKALAKMAIKYRMVTDPNQAEANQNAPMQLGLPAQEVLKVSPGLVQSTPDMEFFDTTEDVEQEFEEEVIETGQDMIIRKVMKKGVRTIRRPVRGTRPSGTESLSVLYSVLNMKAVVALGEALERIEALEAAITAQGQ